ncbi:hypothetical protein M758_1G290000 [Ceratodon purpureus]|nr:hypothetical protein M758_1G290000 [Ceratodon purpureus]
MRLGELGHVYCWCAVIRRNCQSVRCKGLSCTSQLLRSMQAGGKISVEELK